MVISRSFTRWRGRDESNEGGRRKQLEENPEKEMKVKELPSADKERGVERPSLQPCYEKKASEKKKKKKKKKSGEEVAVGLGGEDGHEDGVLLAKELGISQEFVLRMVEAFCYFDKDNSGYLCGREMPDLLRALGRNPTCDELNTIMAEVDVDHNGKVDLREFVVMMYNQVGITDDMEVMRMAFRFFDKNGDGQISKEELRGCILRYGERFVDEDLEEMMKNADLDRNGFIDFSEFVEMLGQAS